MWSALASLVRGHEFKEENLRGAGNGNQVLVESLTAEVFAEIRYKEKVKEASRANETGVDYGWLANKYTSSKYKLSDLDKYQLDLACSLVSPSMCNNIILRFRERSAAEEDVSKIALVMRAVIEEALRDQSITDKEDELKQEVDGKATKYRRLSSSWIKLRESPNKVSPLMLVEQRRTFEIPTLSKTIQDLPV